MESLSPDSHKNMDSFTKPNYSPDILQTNIIEKSDVENQPEPDILQVSSIVDESERVHEEVPKPSALNGHNTKSASFMDNPVFNDGFFSILTNPRTLEFLVSLGDYKQQEDRKLSFHRKYQEHLKNYASLGKQNSVTRRPSNANNSGCSSQFSNYVLKDDTWGECARDGNDIPKNLISTSVDEVADLFAAQLSSQERVILNTKSMKKELSELRKLLLSKHSMYNKSLDEKKNNIKDLQCLLRKNEEEQKELEKKFLNLSERRQKYDTVQKCCEDIIVKVTKTSAESKIIFEEWKSTVTKDIAELKKFTIDTQQSYINWEEKLKKLADEINRESKIEKNLQDIYMQVIFDLEDADKKYLQLKANAEKELKFANLEYTEMESSQQQEIHKLQFDIKKKQCNISALEEDLKAKMKENESLKNLCEELLNSS